MAHALLIGLACAHPSKAPCLRDLAEELRIPLFDAANTYRYVLYLAQAHLELRSVSTDMTPLCVDFTTPLVKQRIHPQRLAQEALIKAIGKKNRHILDVTLGLGRDAFLLAASGRCVLGLERSGVIYALVRDALVRATQDGWTASIAARLTVRCEEAGAYLDNAHNPRVDAVYIDPMHPPRKKTSALVKKEMRVLRDIVGDDLDAGQLLSAALVFAQHRVVVKLPMHSAPLNQRPADFSVGGKTTRYDVYLCANH